MTDKSALAQDASWIKTTCPYCGVGCGVEARTDEQGQWQIRGDDSHPSNYGALCSKGLALGDTLVSDGRLLAPQLNGLRTDWDTALDTVAGGLHQTIAEHGADSVAFYLSGQLLTEDYYVANKLMKGFIGSANVDTNSRLCMSSTVAGHKRAFGSDTVPGCYQDLEQADLLVITGSNLAWCHPVLYQRIKKVKQQRAAGDSPLKVVVVDPRVTATCEIADLHLALTPGTDVALFNGLLNYLASEQLIDEVYTGKHVEGLVAALNTAQQDSGDISALFTTLGQRLGVAPKDIEQFYCWFGETSRVVSLFSQGVNQSSRGTDKVNSIINCHLATGRIGQPGAGPFSVTGQPNAMGGREVGGLANTLAAHMEFGNEYHHELVSEFWQTSTLADKPGLKAVELFDAIDEGRIKAVWIMGTNPVASLPDADRIRRALLKCPLVIVSDCIEQTDTSRCADVLLPALGWGEKSGTVTNSERRISRQRSFMEPTGEARADWQLLCDVAKRMGFGQAFNFANEAEIFDEYARMTILDNEGKRDLDLTGLCSMDRDSYQQLTPQQWPVRQKQTTPVHQRLFTDGQFFTPSGKAQMIAVHSASEQVIGEGDFPLTLNTGRIRDQWHTMTRSGLSPRLAAHLPEPFVSVHPADGQQFNVLDQQLARVKSELGTVLARVMITEDVNPGELFMPIHWTGETASEGRVSSLIRPLVDPVSGQPELKKTPVKIMPWQGESEALLLVSRPLPDTFFSGNVFSGNTWAENDLAEIEYWVKQRLVGGHLYRIATRLAPEELVALLQKVLPEEGQEPGQLLSFSAPLAGCFRLVVLDNGQLQSAIVVAPNLAEQDMEWLQNMLEGPLSREHQLSLLMGEAQGALARGKLVCACKQVGEKQLCDAINDQQLDCVASLSKATGAGTGCGSCVPELQRLLDHQLAAMA